MLPELDATTIPGQIQWFAYGFAYGFAFVSTAFMIKIFKLLGRTNPDL